MTITGCFHRYLIDVSDATPEMIRRAAVEKDAIITDYIGERWDAPALKGIKSLFSLVAQVEDGKVNFQSREHSCFCKHCIEGNFAGCLHADISGALKTELFIKLPFKEVSLKKSCANEDILRINFFKGAMPLNGATPIMIAIRRERLDVNDEPFVLGIMTKNIKETTKETECEYTISGTKSKIVIKKRK